MNKYLPKIIGFFLNIVSYIAPQYAAKIAVQIFSTPQTGKLTSIETEYLKSAIQEDIIYNKFHIKTYHWKGKKDTILLAHGWESNTYRWKDLIDLLKTHDYNIIALDAPAHGASGNKTFNALLYSECICKVVQRFNASIIIGHSVGGMSSVFFQYNYKLPYVEKLVLLGTPANFLGVLKHYVIMMGYSKRVITSINQYITKHFNHPPEYFSASNFSKDIAIKGLIIHDKKDRIISYKDGLLFKQNYTNSKFIDTKGFGHALKSDKIYQYILEFINA